MELAEYALETVRAGGDLTLYRGRHPSGASVLALVPAAPETPANRRMLEHEYSLAEELDPAWAVRPLALAPLDGRLALILEDIDGDPLDGMLGRPLEFPRFLKVAISIAAALRQAHRHGLIHKRVEPANVIVDVSGAARLTGFGLATRLPRARQAPTPPEVIAGTFAYMAPEQTGRMNRSIDTRSDLYSLGVTFYEMLTGVLPFTASDPMEWIHCHIARQPISPSLRTSSVPEPVAAIVLKLLAKNAEDRYQTAAGVEADLQHCLEAWNSSHGVDPFLLATNDASDRLQIPEKLYGRESETDTLLAAFDRVVRNEATELVLISGHAGIGKSSFVNELHKVLVPPRGLFAAGKFDQYKRNIPYATLAQAFQGLVRHLLGMNDAELDRWRKALSEAFGQNGQLMVNLIPELALIVGEQPPVPDLPQQEWQNRFQLVFRRFLGVFARREHPLALFVDDLQWLDSATLELIEHLVVQPEVRHLLLIGAYRDNEVGPSHPLARMPTTIRGAGGKVHEILLSPLIPDDVERLLADALHADRERVRPLADLVFEKTDGNPFFAIQFLTALKEEALLAFDPGTAQWIWDLPRIRAKGFTDNVVDLMAAKLSRLPPLTQKTLAEFACLGNSAETATLVLVHEGTEEALHTALWEAARAGLVIRSDRTYAFLHDRIQEAAYALIDEGERPEAHLRIGRLLVAATPLERIEESVFDIVDQFDRGATLIVGRREGEQVAELNLVAGKRAKAATAYASAFRYLTVGRALLAENEWEDCYQLTFQIELNRAECEYLTGELALAEEHLSTLSVRARTTVDAAAVACMRINIHTTRDQSDSAVEVGLDYLRRVDGPWPARPTASRVRQEYDLLWRRLGSDPIEALVDLPLLRDPDRRATMDVLTVLTSPALFTDMNLFRLVVGRMGTLSLEHGNSDGSCLAYAWLGGVLGTYFGDYQAGFRFGSLGLDLLEKHGLDRFRARVYLVFAVHVSNWTQPLRVCGDFLERTFRVAQDAGDVSYAAYSRSDLVTNRFARGDSLGEVQREAEHGLEFAHKVRFGLVSDILTAQHGLIRTLRGLTPDFTSFSDAEFDEVGFSQRLESNPQIAICANWFWLRKLIAYVYAGDSAPAIAAASKVESSLWTTPTQFELAEYHFYAALARARHCDTCSAEERSEHLQALAAHHEQLTVWAKSCPVTFVTRAALVGAEIARLEGRELAAMRLYEAAIRSASANGFVHNEGLANEAAARFYAKQDLEKAAYGYLRDARDCYLRWGADGKVRQLDHLYPRLREEKPLSGSTSSIETSVEHLDLATVIKVSQAVSGEIVLEKLIDTLMRTAIEYAGAERGVLILLHGTEPRIEAEATTSGDAVSVRMRQGPVDAAALPPSIVQFVVRTQESVILDDASTRNPFSPDVYINRARVRSLLCLPLINQAKLVGVLYLENNLTPHAFTRDRIAVLRLLASQAAISLENTRLYRDLEEREAKIRRLVDANIIGIFIWDLAGEILEANDAFLQMIRYDREDLASGLRWTDLTPAEWRDQDERTLREVRANAIVQSHEKEYLRKDGSRVPVLLGFATFGETPDQGVAFVVDLTERKRAEAEVRESERRYMEVQTELAHANRVATIGQLSASIAHEVTQPLSAALMNADTALRWLGRQPPDLEKVRHSLGRIVSDASRATDIIGRIRALIKKAPARNDVIDVNEAILEVVAFTRGEALKNGVTVRTELGDDTALVRGDRVQLQQVVLNLIINGIEAMLGVAEGSRELRIGASEAEPDRVLVSVADSGSGLPSSSLERVFEAFYTTKPTGLGMGLSVCRSIVEAHGGRLWAAANAPHGATFQFTLPAHRRSAS